MSQQDKSPDKPESQPFKQDCPAPGRPASPGGWLATQPVRPGHRRQIDNLGPLAIDHMPAAHLKAGADLTLLLPVTQGPSRDRTRCASHALWAHFQIAP